MRGPTFPFRLGWLLWLSALGVPSLAGAKSDVPLPADLLGSNTDPGYRGVLEANGKSVHNVGNIFLNITNFGMIGSQPGTNRPWSGAPSAQWPAGSTTEYLWSAGLWIGGLKYGQPHVTTGQFEMEFRPGHTQLDRIYQAREGVPGGNRRPALNSDDDADGKIDEDPLDGRDNDGDGRIDEDFGAISNQMFYCEYNDTDPGIKLTYPEHESLGLLVQQSSMAWGDPVLNNAIVFDFKLINQGSEAIEAVYAGFLADCDVGPRSNRDSGSDDMAGFWEGSERTLLGTTTKSVDLSLGYMWDADGDEGRSEGYIGFMFLGEEHGAYSRFPRTRINNFRSFSGHGSFLVGGDPSNDSERYSVLDGTARFSLLPADSSWGKLRPPQITKTPNDYRIVVSAQPLGWLSPGDTLEFQAALVIGRGFEGLKQSAAQTQLLMEGQWADCDHDLKTGVFGRESPRCWPEFEGKYFYVDGPGDYAYPSNPAAKVIACDSTCINAPRFNRCWTTAPYKGCTWINADCDPTTGIDGNECLVRWLTGLAPVAPNMRLVAKEGEVDVMWDNLSETTPDQRSNVVDFESYRIWRADNWRRPLGSDANVGPAGSLWMLVGEYDLRNNHIGADTGLEEIRYTPPIPEGAIDFYREWYKAHPFQPGPALPGFTPGQLDTAQAMGRGARYYRFVDPPFKSKPSPSDPPCEPDGTCGPIQTPNGTINRRCDSRGRCRPTVSPPQSGRPYFYSVTATDHKMALRNGVPVATGPGLAGEPMSNFRYIEPPTDALQPQRYDEADQEIYVVPNPATSQTMAPWRLGPNNDDPSGWKIEFHHLPATTGKITIFTIAGDMVKEVPFDGSAGDGTAKWNLLSRNGQDVTSGVYLYSVATYDGRFKRFVGKFVVVR